MERMCLYLLEDGVGRVLRFGYLARGGVGVVCFFLTSILSFPNPCNSNYFP